MPGLDMGREKNFQAATQLDGRVFARAAGRVTMPANTNTVDATLPTGITVGGQSSVLVTPQQDLGAGTTFFARALSSNTIRIVTSAASASTRDFAWAVFN